MSWKVILLVAACRLVVALVAGVGAGCVGWFLGYGLGNPTNGAYFCGLLFGLIVLVKLTFWGAIGREHRRETGLDPARLARPGIHAGVRRGADRGESAVRG